MAPTAAVPHLAQSAPSAILPLLHRYIFGNQISGTFPPELAQLTRVDTLCVDIAWLAYTALRCDHEPLAIEDLEYALMSTPSTVPQNASPAHYTRFMLCITHLLISCFASPAPSASPCVPQAPTHATPHASTTFPTTYFTKYPFTH
eukprot:2403834-Pleurochrysis_carterae.AAC.2